MMLPKALVIALLHSPEGAWRKPFVITQSVLIQCAFQISNFLRIPPQAAYLIDRLTVLHVSNNFITCNTFFLIFISMSLCNVKVQCKVLHLLFVYVFYFIFFVKLPLPILLMQGNLAFGFHSCCNSDAKLLTQLAKIFWALVSFAKKKKTLIYHHSLSTYKYTTWNKPF